MDHLIISAESLPLTHLIPVHLQLELVHALVGLEDLVLHGVELVLQLLHLASEAADLLTEAALLAEGLPGHKEERHSTQHTAQELTQHEFYC